MILSDKTSPERQSVGMNEKKFQEKLARELGEEETSKKTLPQLISAAAEGLAQAFADRLTAALFEEEPEPRQEVKVEAPPGEGDWTYSVDGQRIKIQIFACFVPATQEEVTRLERELKQATVWFSQNTSVCASCLGRVPAGVFKCSTCLNKRL